MKKRTQISYTLTVGTLYGYSRRKILQPLLLYCLALSFILPVYHTHGYPEALPFITYSKSDASQKPVEDGLSHSGNKGVSHLHFKKEFTRTRSQCQAKKNGLLVLSFVPNTPVSHFDNCAITPINLGSIICRSADVTSFSGLSPPSI